MFISSVKLTAKLSIMHRAHQEPVSNPGNSCSGGLGCEQFESLGSTQVCLLLAEDLHSKVQTTLLSYSTVLHPTPALWLAHIPGVGCINFPSVQAELAYALSYRNGL